ncbi:MAG TPA: tyrosine-type recombinase/integrase [Candidatus Thermoplasmatota archaeon]|nr:tyrosine-type recombinase/integrase [Candidatus Thermoplasmatota archaeon]
MVPPKQLDLGGFGDFVAPPAALVEIMDRRRYGGREPEDAARMLIEDYHAKRPLRPSTRRQKEVEFRKILRELGQKNVDMATVTTAVLTEYRAYLQSLVTTEEIDEDYAYNLVKDWNAMVNLLFGEKDNKPGTGLKMKGFRQTPKEVDHLDIEDIEAMIRVLPRRRFLDETYRGAMHTYLELSMASAGRWSSIGAAECTFADIDWVQGTIEFQVVKNRPKHKAVLTERALRRLRDWRGELIRARRWKGEKTPIMTASRGVVTYGLVNPALHDLATLAGIRKNVTTHVTRKSVGTHMGKENPRLAREQLGITDKVFQRHYNQPTVKDRIDRRDLLIGAEGSAKTAEARIGALFLQMRKGVISQQEFDREVSRGLLSEATKPQPKSDDSSYA